MFGPTPDPRYHAHDFDSCLHVSARTVLYSLFGAAMCACHSSVQAAPHVAGVAANCLMSGACKSTNTGAQSMAVIMDDAEDRAGMGAPVVKYNPQDTVAAGKWFGYLLYAKY